jgi:GNAT superfamily N-acetyltransferase
MNMNKNQLNLKFEFLVDRQSAIPIVANWYFAEWGHSVPGNSIAKTIDRIEGKLNRDRVPLHILVIEDEKVLGVAQLKRYEMEIDLAREFWLGSLFVLPTARGKGIGSALADRIATIATEFKIPEIYLQTEVLDGGLYRRMGWHSIETVRYHGIDVTVMVRKLGGY